MMQKRSLQGSDVVAIYLAMAEKLAATDVKELAEARWNEYKHTLLVLMFCYDPQYLAEVKVFLDYQESQENSLFTIKLLSNAAVVYFVKVSFYYTFVYSYFVILSNSSLT